MVWEPDKYMEIELGEVIAERSLIRELNGISTEVKVLIGKPCQKDGVSSFFTPYQYRGFGREDVRYAGGVDSVQSLQLAMLMIGAELDAYNRKSGNSISWECGTDGDLGFGQP